MSTVKLSVSGLKSEFHRDILQGRQHQKLPQLVSDAVKQGTPLEFSFDRPSGMFTYILAYYQSGELHMPTCVCPAMFEKELNFWGIDAEELSQCCYFRYTRFLNDYETQRKFKRDTMVTGSTTLPLVPVKPKGGVAGFREKIWRVVDNNTETLAARIYFGAVVSLIVLSIIGLALSTEPNMRRAINKCELIEYLRYTNFHEMNFIEVALGKPTCTWDSRISSSEEIKVDEYDWQRLWKEYFESLNNDEKTEDDEDDDDNNETMDDTGDDNDSREDDISDDTGDNDDGHIDTNDKIVGSSNDNTIDDMNDHIRDNSNGRTEDNIRDHTEDTNNNDIVGGISNDTGDNGNDDNMDDISDDTEDTNSDSAKDGISDHTFDDSNGHTVGGSDHTVHASNHTDDSSNNHAEVDVRDNIQNTSNDHTVDELIDQTADTSSNTIVGDIGDHIEDSSTEDTAGDISGHTEGSINEDRVDGMSDHIADISGENTEDDTNDLAEDKSINHTEGVINDNAKDYPSQLTEQNTDDHPMESSETGKLHNDTHTTIKSSSNNVTKSISIPNLTVPVFTLGILEQIAMVLFTLDFFIRLFSCPSVRRYFLSCLNVIDACALVSSYIYVIVLSIQKQYRYERSWIHTLEYLQIFRVFRLFRVVQNVRTTRVLVYSIRKNLRDVLVIALLLLLAVAIFSTVFFFTEEKITVDSIPEAWYWAIVTLTTVGYGDLSPKTYPGRLVASLCAVYGIMILAVTLQIFVNNFLVYYDISCVEEASEIRKSKNCATSGFARDVSMNGSSKKAVAEQETKVIVLT